ncbi:MAG: hypothetical protein OEZ13_13635 [Spirochaetia bacterium]|nr:hypothetical protein [Spirochaetia bacterium]
MKFKNILSDANGSLAKTARFILAVCSRGLIIMLAIFYAVPLFSQDAKKRIAVLPFKYGGGIIKGEADFLTENVRAELIETGLFEVITNDQIEEMMKIKEQKQGVGEGSCNTEECIIDLGNALECEKMLVGTAMGAFGEYNLTGKILDVVSQKYEGAANLKISDKNKFPDAANQMVHQLVDHYVEELEKERIQTSLKAENKTFNGMLWRSLVLPGWGHIYANQKRGWLYSAIYAASAGVFIWSHVDFLNKEKRYDNSNESVEDTMQYYDDLNKAYKARGYMSYAFLSVAALIIADAVIAGRRYFSHEKLFSNQFIRKQKNTTYFYAYFSDSKRDKNYVETKHNFIFKRYF